jgi:hypothetical protein
MRDRTRSEHVGAARAPSPGHEALPVSRVAACSRHPLSFYDVRAILSGTAFAGEGAAADAANALRLVAEWLDTYISRPHEGLGRSGEVCPWTRRTIDLGKLELVPISSTDASEVDVILDSLLDRFVSAESPKGADVGFRSTVGVFHRLDAETAAEFIVDAHRRSKPAFLHHGLMLGEFYPTCAKPGLRNPTFRPLRSPVPLLVIRQMVEPDIEFLLDKDEFIESYLRTHRSRGFERLLRILEQRPSSLPPERAAELERVAREHRHLRTRPPPAP